MWTYYWRYQCFNTLTQIYVKFIPLLYMVILCGTITVSIRRPTEWCHYQTWANTPTDRMMSLSDLGQYADRQNDFTIRPGQILLKVFKYIAVTFTEKWLQLHYNYMTCSNVMITIIVTDYNYNYFRNVSNVSRDKLFIWLLKFSCV